MKFNQEEFLFTLIAIFHGIKFRTIAIHYMHEKETENLNFSKKDPVCIIILFLI